MTKRQPRNSAQQRRRNNNTRKSNNKASNSLNLPNTTGPQDKRPRFNPTWNPQYLKVARIFQYSAPAADFGGGFGKIQDPAVGASVTLLAYNSGVMTFALSDIPSVAEYTTLFDQYKLAAVRLDMQYISASEAVLATTTAITQIVTVMVYEDNDDSTAPAASNAGWSAILESGRAKKLIFPGNKNTFSYTLKPKILTAELDVAGTTLARGLANPWLDAATTDAKFFGLKWIMQANPAPVTLVHQIRVTATYYMEWRNRQ